MARYKVLHSIAHNFGQTFVGASKERADDHLLGRLLADARRTGEATLRLDILRRRGDAGGARQPVARPDLERYVRGFPELVSGGHTDMQVIRGARMELTFDLATERPSWAPPTSASRPSSAGSPSTTTRARPGSRSSGAGARRSAPDCSLVRRGA